jgi:hypothetical protein
MKTLILTSTAIAFAFTLNLSANASAAPDGAYSIEQMAGSTSIDRRRPRVPGGSGCDSVRDILEHPECR